MNTASEQLANLNRSAATRQGDWRGWRVSGRAAWLRRGVAASEEGMSRQGADGPGISMLIGAIRAAMLTVALLCLVLVPAQAATAQCPPDWLPGRPSPGTRPVSAVTVLPNGDIIAGGPIRTAGGVPVVNIARFSPATDSFSALGPGLNNSVYALVTLANGDVIAAGAFSGLSGGPPTLSRIARYNPASNTWSALGSGLNNDVSALAVLPGGDLIAGGDFTMAGGVPARAIARYQFSTGVWSAIGPEMSDGVRALAVLPNGDLVAGGWFSAIGGVVVNRVARYSFASGTWTPLGSGVNNPVYALAVLPGGDVVVGGEFTTAGGVTRNHVARFNFTTNAWSSMGAGTDGWVAALLATPSGDVIVTGLFYAANNVAARNSIARYNPSTGAWSGLGVGLASPSAADGRCLALLPGGEIVVGGGFYSAGGIATEGIARYNLDTGAWRPLGGGANGIIRAMVALPGGDAIIGGEFTSVGYVPVSRIARYDPVANIWSPLGAGVSNGTSGFEQTAVRAIAIEPNGDIVVCGKFTRAGSVPAVNIARYSPATNAWSAIGAPFAVNDSQTDFRAVAVLPDGDIVVGGYFSMIGGSVRTSIARYRRATNTWSNMNGGVSSPNSTGSNPAGVVNALCMIPNGDLVVAGWFHIAGGVAAESIARYNPATNSWIAIGSSVSDTIDCLALLPGGDVVVGGGFLRTPGGGTANNSIARVNPLTGAWSGFGQGVGQYVRALTVMPGGDLIVGGSFGGPTSSLPAGVARLNPTTSVWSALGAGLGSNGTASAYAVAVLANGKLLTGGDFHLAGGRSSSYFARYSFGEAAPSITVQPRSATSCPGRTVSFAAAASGSGPFGYQWRKAGVPISAAANPSATSGMLILALIQMADAGVYDCVVTGACGTVITSGATLTITICPCSIADIAGGGPNGDQPDGRITGADLAAFVAAFDGTAEADIATADIAGAGGNGLEPDGTVDGNDYVAFINAYMAGCAGGQPGG